MLKLYLSSEWTKSESEKTGLYGNIYDFVVDYKPIVGVIVSSRVGTPPLFLREPPLSGYPPLSEANLKSYPPLSESHPNWCM